MNFFTKTFTALAIPLFLIATSGCSKKTSEETLAAQEMAKAADQRVANLEQQLADLKAGKHQPTEANQTTAEHVSKSQAKALQRQLDDARKSAEAKHKVASELATAPAREAPKPVIVEVPEGTPIIVKPVQELTTSTVQPGDAWDGTLTEDVGVGGKTVWKAGMPVRGVVTQSTPAGRLSSGQGSLGIKVTLLGQEDVDTAAYVMVGDKRGGRNAKFIGGGAALGALIGILSDKKNQGDHALGGAAIGAAAGTATAAATADTVIKIPAEKPITFTLAAPEKVMIKP
jgi:Skp family chaperone for outer membrane proteins